MSNFSYKFDNRRETKVYQKLLIYANIILRSKLIVFPYFLITRFKLCKNFHAAISNMVSSIIMILLFSNFVDFIWNKLFPTYPLTLVLPHLVLDRTLRRFADCSEECSDIFWGIEVRLCLRRSSKTFVFKTRGTGEIRTFPYFTSSVEHCPCLTV